MTLHRKSVFIAVNASFRWLNTVRGVYLVKVSFILIGWQGLERLFLVSAHASHCLEDCAIFRKTINTVPTSPNAIQAACNTPLSMNNYTPLVISGNDKNKQLTLIGQCNLALTTTIVGLKIFNFFVN